MDNNGTCFNSRIISEKLIKTNPSFTLKHKSFSAASEIHDVQTICNNVTCHNLNFQQYSQHSFCVYRGKVGICTKSRCILPPYVSRRQPSIPNDKKAGCGSLLQYFRAWTILILINTFIM